MKILLGYFIRRSVRDADSVRGKTFSAYPHELYPTRSDAERVLGGIRKHADKRYTYDVAEAYMEVGES